VDDAAAASELAAQRPDLAVLLPRPSLGLDEAQAVMVVQMAKTQSILFGGVENFLVTREFDKIATREQKIALLHCLFGVSAADLSISSAEDTTIRAIADELHLDHADFIAVKSVYGSLLATRHRTGEPDPRG